MKRRTSQGSVYGIVAAVIGVVLLAAVGFVFWQNFMGKKGGEESKVTQQADKKKETPKEEKKAEIVPDLIDYGKDGVAIATEADLAKLTNASEPFKAHIWEQVKSNTSTIPSSTGQMNCNATVVVRKLYKQAYAEGALETTCGPRSNQLWGNPDGAWKLLTGAHATWYMCEPLRQYKVPSIIVENKCFENGKDIAYQQV